MATGPLGRQRLGHRRADETMIAWTGNNQDGAKPIEESVVDSGTPEMRGEAQRLGIKGEDWLSQRWCQFLAIFAKPWASSSPSFTSKARSKVESIVVFPGASSSLVWGPFLACLIPASFVSSLPPQFPSSSLPSSLCPSRARL